MCGHRYSSLTLYGLRIGEERRNVLVREGRYWRDEESLLPVILCQGYFCRLQIFPEGTSTLFTPDFRLVSSLFSPEARTSHYGLCSSRTTTILLVVHFSLVASPAVSYRATGAAMPASAGQGSEGPTAAGNRGGGHASQKWLFPGLPDAMGTGCP